MRASTSGTWVVYLMPMKKCPDGIRAVCEQSEWEVMDKAKPGYFTLIESGIANEGEAERLARGTSGAAVPRTSKLRLSWPDDADRVKKPAVS